MGAGSPISRPGTCQWAGQGKIVTLTITQTKGGKTPVDQFNASKKSTLPGIAVEPVSGVGDDAFYVSYGGNTSTGFGLVVKKGSSSFEFRVYGFKDQSKTVAKTLALDIVPRVLIGGPRCPPTVDIAALMLSRRPPSPSLHTLGERKVTGYAITRVDGVPNDVIALLLLALLKSNRS